MLGFIEWETAVVEELAETIQVSYSDASGIVESQPRCTQELWSKGVDPKTAAGKILAEAQS